jgi:hypothetical protein
MCSIVPGIFNQVLLPIHLLSPTLVDVQHGGRDRHFCIGVHDISPLVEKLKAHDITYTMSMSGRPAVFFRDPGESFEEHDAHMYSRP